MLRMGWGYLNFNQLPPISTPHKNDNSKIRELLRRRTFQTPFKLILAPLTKLVLLKGSYKKFLVKKQKFWNPHDLRM